MLIQAVDLDEGNNSAIVYEILDTEKFIIDKYSGVLTCLMEGVLLRRVKWRRLLPQSVAGRNFLRDV